MGLCESIDPVRYVGNRSTGKQGYALAEAALARGTCHSISTVDLEFSAGINLVRVESAQQMSEAVFQRVDADVIVMAAAVADFRPADVSNRKIKKDAGPPQIVLEQTQDILSALGAAKRPDQVIVGFAERLKN